MKNTSYQVLVDANTRVYTSASGAKLQAGTQQWSRRVSGGQKGLRSEVSREEQSPPTRPTASGAGVGNPASGWGYSAAVPPGGHSGERALNSF